MSERFSKNFWSVFKILLAAFSTVHDHEAAFCSSSKAAFLTWKETKIQLTRKTWWFQVLRCRRQSARRPLEWSFLEELKNIYGNFGERVYEKIIFTVIIDNAMPCQFPVVFANKSKNLKNSSRNSFIILNFLLVWRCFYFVTQYTAINTNINGLTGRYFTFPKLFKKLFSSLSFDFISKSFEDINA